MLRHSLLLLAGLAGVAPVQAADMAVTPAQRVEQAWSWNGFYIGAHGGYGWGKDNFTTNAPPPNLTALDMRGWVAGGHAGYTWQRGIFVGGFEVDMSFTGIKGSSSFVGFDALGFNSGARSLKYDYLGTARVRFGAVPTQHVLLYATGGLAWSHATLETRSTQILTGIFAGINTSQFISDTGTIFGYVIGGGAEASLAIIGLSNLLMRIEYLHYDFGKQDSSVFATTGPFANTTAATGFGPLTAEVVRAGMTWLF